MTERLDVPSCGDIGADHRIGKRASSAEDFDAAEPATAGRRKGLQVTADGAPECRVTQPILARSAVHLTRDTASDAKSKIVASRSTRKVLDGGEARAHDTSGAAR